MIRPGKTQDGSCLFHEADALVERWLVQPAEDVGSSVRGCPIQVVASLQVYLLAGPRVGAAQCLTDVAEKKSHPQTC